MAQNSPQMTSKDLGWIILLVVLLVVGYALGYKTAPVQIKTVTQKETQTVYQKPLIPNRSTNIIVWAPYPQQEVNKKITIVGEARVFESQFTIQLKNEAGKVIAQKTITTVNGDVGQFNLFKGVLNFTVTQKTNATLEAFDYSAKDGSIQDLVSIPVVLTP